VSRKLHIFPSTDFSVAANVRNDVPHYSMTDARRKTAKGRKRHPSQTAVSGHSPHVRARDAANMEADIQAAS
jgi:hypothetical protein